MHLADDQIGTARRHQLTELSPCLDTPQRCECYKKFALLKNVESLLNPGSFPSLPISPIKPICLPLNWKENTRILV